VILPDNDEAGRNHAQNVASSLWRNAEVINIIELPNLPPKGDVSDWLEAGGSLEALLRLVDSSPVWNRTPKSPALQKALQQLAVLR
jgi:hypothetical protein